MERVIKIYGCLVSLLQKCVFRILSVGPIPKHIAFIMDGNRRYSKRCNSMEGSVHKAGSSVLKSMLKYCYEFGVRYVTVYAFSIDNFKRNPEEVQSLMDLMVEKIEGVLKEESHFSRYGIRIMFSGNLQLLSEPVRLAAERAMLATADNSRAVFSVCVAYSSTDEILRAVRKSCEEKWDEITAFGLGESAMDHRITLADIEKHMYMAAVPDPDIIIRSSGETRLSNFLLWQSTTCYLYSPSALWPEMGFRHFLWGVLNFQRLHFYLDKKRKQL